MPRLPIFVDGDCDSRFEAVKQIFRDNFTQGLEGEGAAFAVYVNGEKVVDLWGGYADSSANRKWKSNTISLFFSTTKSICAICFAMLVDRGLVKYEDLVTQYWPEFGQNGKEKITIDQLLSHQAGLAYVDGVIDEAHVKDWRKMATLIEKQTPNWKPGEFVGYHAVTFGWLVDQLIRRIDPKKRSLSTFFKEEIVEPYNLDITIGSLLEHEHRVARLCQSPRLSIAKEIMEYPTILRFLWNLFTMHHSPNAVIRKIFQNIVWMGNDILVFNNPDYRSLDIPSATGIGTARSLAKLHSLLAQGRLVKPQTLEKIITPVFVDKFDMVLTVPESKGKGFVFTKNSKGQWLVGHPGIGGQNAKADVKNKVAFAYICNALKAGVSDYTATFMRLQNCLYECLEKNSLLAETPVLSPSAATVSTPVIAATKDGEAVTDAATTATAQMVVAAATEAAAASLAELHLPPPVKLTPLQQPAGLENAYQT